MPVHGIQDVYANVLIEDGPHIPLANLKPYVKTSDDFGRRTWVLDPGVRLKGAQLEQVRRELEAWRSTWHRRYRLDPAANIAFLREKASSSSSAWNKVTPGSALEPAQCANLLVSLEDVRASVASLKIECVVLADGHTGSAIRSWPPGAREVLSQDGGVEVAVEPDGLHVTCPKHGSDPVHGWSDGGTRLWVRCSGAAESLDTSARCAQDLMDAGLGCEDVKVLMRPWSVSIARTLDGLAQASKQAVSSVRYIMFTEGEQ